MKISIKGFISPKEAELFYDCADRYAINEKVHKFAISDGVSKSFFPKVWADVLVSNWVNNQWESDSDFISSCQEDWLNKVTKIAERSDTKWFTKNAFNRKEPGLATFVSLRFFKKKKEWFWKAHALGDSYLFFVPSNLKNFESDVLKLSSKSEPIEFDNFPDYLSSRSTTNHKGEHKPLSETLSEGIFFLMTDALAEWFINEKENAIHKIEVWQNQTEFERFISKERLSKKLGNDDSAILAIKIEDDKKDDLTYDSVKISDINALIEIQQKEIEEAAKKAEEDKSKEQEEPNSEVSPEKIEESESIEIENSEEKITNSEKNKKGLPERFFEHISNFVSGKKEEKQSDIEIKVNNDGEEEKSYQQERIIIPQSEENKLDIEISENQETLDSETNEREMGKPSKTVESNLESRNPEAENQLGKPEEKPTENEEKEAKMQSLKKDSKSITDKF
ncbi:hypothetical protein [Mangrovimonas xylaniphaga]|uniref:hypothetical protein n=1 Tax=Mangrovimonas xylaniphaga TaxID=1645915 RepID=UPI0006B5A39E|nr:hypothetical protein [Mangrovimonas xylaniphaga]